MFLSPVISLAVSRLIAKFFDKPSNSFFINHFEDLLDAGFYRDAYNEFLGLLVLPFQKIGKSHKEGTEK